MGGTDPFSLSPLFSLKPIKSTSSVRFLLSEPCATSQGLRLCELLSSRGRCPPGGQAGPPSEDSSGSIRMAGPYAGTEPVGELGPPDGPIPTISKHTPGHLSPLHSKPPQTWPSGWVSGARGGQRGGVVEGGNRGAGVRGEQAPSRPRYLDQPGLQPAVDDDVVAVALEAVLVVVHHRLQRESRVGADL